MLFAVPLELSRMGLLARSGVGAEVTVRSSRAGSSIDLEVRIISDGS